MRARNRTFRLAGETAGRSNAFHEGGAKLHPSLDRCGNRRSFSQYHPLKQEKRKLKTEEKKKMKTQTTAVVNVCTCMNTVVRSYACASALLPVTSVIPRVFARLNGLTSPEVRSFGSIPARIGNRSSNSDQRYSSGY